MPNFSNLTSVSSASGYKNYLASTFTSTIPAQVLAPGGFVTSTASTPLNNANSISQVQVNWGGLETFYRILNGYIFERYAGATYEVQSYYFFDATNLNVTTIVSNQTAGNVNIPTITITCRGFLFLAPF